MEFRVLGPLEVSAGLQRLGLGGARQQAVLAMLLLSANRVVSLERLVEAVYGADPPATARLQVQIIISSVRRLLAPHGQAEVIATHERGYRMQVGAGELDADRFAGLVAAAAAAREAGELGQAVASYRDALRLWRGPAFDGIDSQLVQAAASRLDEQRITAIEDRLTVELDLGRHRELVGELVELAAEFPLRERLRGQLMLALYRCDRTAEALAVYRETRRTMVDELGIEPGERLQWLEHAVLTADPSLDLPVRPVRGGPVPHQAPRMLPTDIADFTGRAEETSQIRRFLVPGAGPEARLAVPVVVITGRGGIGKTSLAVHVAHRLEAEFPDGQLFADLHGGSPHPAGPLGVLERFLRALGVPGAQVPEGLDERAEMYRSLLAGQKILVVLDDAGSESQVSPLIPGSQAAAVIITGRSGLVSLAGVSRVEVGAFDIDDSVELLARIAGPERVRVQPAQAAAVAEHCGHLPLALRIAGARLAARRHWSIGQLADRLADETRRLDELRHGSMAVRLSISLSYDSASEQARVLFRRLALLDQPAFSGWLAAALLDQPPEHAEELLDELVSAQLIETTVSSSQRGSQYRFHELVRAFAQERLAAEFSPAEWQAALERALGALLYLAQEAQRAVLGGDWWIPGDVPRWPLPASLTERLVRDPMSWYETERVALVAGVAQAARAGLTEICWALAYSATPFFEVRAYLDDWRETHDIALAAARSAHDVRGEAAMLSTLAELESSRRRLGPTRQSAAEAARLFQEIGDEYGQAMAIRYIAMADRLSGRLDDAMRNYEHAVAILRRTGSPLAIGYVLHGMAGAELDRDEPGPAMELLSEALRLTRIATAGGIVAAGRQEAQVQYRMGEACLQAGDLAGAVEAFQAALLRVRDIGDPIGEASVLRGLGIARLRQDEPGQAREALQRAAELAVATGDRLVETQVLRGLSELALASGDLGQAATYAQQAVSLSQAVGAPLEEARALIVLSEAHAARGDTGAAGAAAADAAAVRANLTAR